MGTFADWVIEFLEKQKIDFVFGHPGGPVLPLYEAMRKNTGVKHVLVRHEGAGSFMADAYSKVTGKTGVCISTMGPGAANMTIGVATAMSDSTPLIAITGQLPLGVQGKGYQQETDHLSLFRGITKKSVQLKEGKSASDVFISTYRTAITGRPGPVHLDIPSDVSSFQYDYRRPDYLPRTRSGPASQEQVKEAARMISDSERPIVLAGGGVIASEASEVLAKFSDEFGIPIATSYNGRGVVPENSPLCVGRIGEYVPGFRLKLAESADLLIALGFRFTDVSMEGWKISNDSKVIQIDIDPTELGKNIPVDIGLAGDIRETLLSLSEFVRSEPGKRREWIDHVKDEKRAWSESYNSLENSSAIPIKPQRLIKEISEVAGTNSIITSGAGRAKMWAASVLPIHSPRTWIHSGGYAVMGYELPAAIACKLVHPEKNVISIGGDASFQMHCQELATAVESQVNTISIVINDRSLGSIRNSQLRRYQNVFGTEFNVDVNLARVAEAFGAKGIRIDRPQDIKPSLVEALKSDKPVVLDVIVDSMETPTF
ncbi:MAG: thiamine pyrophosphate-binding protein [Nitrososphaerota archaeon]|nr:thiamine pyrophosphate-binding protein [Nitrososphaerota archaeon]